MSTITPHYRSIQQLLQTQSFSIDEYQREYKWDKKNINELLTDLQDKFLSCYQPNHETSAVANYEDYFLGSIIVSKRNGKNYLVDGQQRVTSITLLLIYLYRAAKAQSHPIVTTLAPLIYSDNLGRPCFNLDITERLPVIKALFNGEEFTPDGKEESIQTMYARYSDIEDKDLVGELDEALPNFIYWLMTKVGLIEIATDNDNYAYAIFETMNDRGKPLSPVDMLKAYLLAPIEDAELRRLANQTWKKQVLDLISWGGDHDAERDSACIKAWLRSQFAETKREGKAGSTDKDWELIGSVFHRWVRDNSSRIGLGKDEGNLDMIRKDLPFFSGVYQQILGASRTYTPGLEAIFYNAHNEFTWQSTVLMAPLCVSDDTECVRKKLAVTSTYLDIWLMRRVVNYIRVGYSGTSYTMYSLCKEIRNKTLDELVIILSNRLANDDDVTFEGSKSRGRLGIVDLRLNQFSRRYIYHFLARLTSYVEVQSGMPDLFDKYTDRTMNNACDIEHVIADNYNIYQSDFISNEEFQSWRNHVASLLLLPADVNRSYQDKSFEDKGQHYSTQNLYAASLTASTYQHRPKFLAFRDSFHLPFKPFNSFGKKEQKERCDLVLALAEFVWSPARLTDIIKA